MLIREEIPGEDGTCVSFLLPSCCHADCLRRWAPLLGARSRSAQIPCPRADVLEYLIIIYFSCLMVSLSGYTYISECVCVCVCDTASV